MTKREFLLPRDRVDAYAEEIARRYGSGTAFLINYIRAQLLLGRVKVEGVPIKVVDA